MQAVVEQHDALPVAVLLAVHVAALGLDVVRGDLAPVVPVGAAGRPSGNYMAVGIQRSRFFVSGSSM